MTVFRCAALENDPTGAVILGVNTDTGDLMIPDQVTLADGTRTVREIGERAFEGKHFENVVIPGEVRIIGTAAFKNNRSLMTVRFTGTSELETIGDYAFAYCTNLRTFNFPFRAPRPSAQTQGNLATDAAVAR
jgi:hypothetical protein